MTPPREAATDDSSTEDDAASQTTEDDPQIPESQHAPPPPAQPHPPAPAPPVAAPPAPPNPTPSNVHARARPRYELKHTLSGHTMSISSVKFSPDGTLLASCGNVPFPSPWKAADNVAKIWSPSSGELIRNLNGHTKGCRILHGLQTACTSPRHPMITPFEYGMSIPCVSSANMIMFCAQWGVRKGLTSRVLKGHSSYVFCVNYNTEGTQLVSGGCDGDVKIWNTTKGERRIWSLPSGQCLKTLAEGHNAICQHVQFSPNSKYILSTAHDSAIRLWDFQTSRCLKTYVGHQNAKYCIAACFSVTGGKWIVSGSEDSKIYLWDLQSREVMQVLEGHHDVVVAVAVSNLTGVAIMLSIISFQDPSSREYDRVRIYR
ncbi:WD40-repeat-containing domain protein [Lactifluus subvellereus]|nr:WD40-repeat-containing domain protein [Lactifluus subvellereus]